MMPYPRHSARLVFERTEDPSRPFACRLPEAGAGLRRALILLDTTSYPLERHCCYMRRRGDDEPYTFSRMEFSTSPPGIRVGPWPGWRGIPPLPDITVAWENGTANAEAQFWGDELECRHLRAVAWLPPECGGMLYCITGDIRFAPIALDLYEDEPIAALPKSVHIRRELIGRHPRLLVTPDRLAELAAAVRTTRNAEWMRLCALVDGPQLPFETTAESKTLSGPERLRPEDRAMITAWIALLDPAPDRIEQALAAYRAFLQDTCDPDYAPLTIDTQSGEILFLLVLCFDWLHDRFSESERSRIHEWLRTVAARVRAHLPAGRRDFAQAHYLGCALGLIAFAFAFWEQHPESETWAAEFRGALDTILEMLPADGFHPHGANLWIYEYGFLLRWVELFHVCTGEDLWRNAHWMQASSFRAAGLSSDGRFGITFGDPQYRVGGDSWCHYLIAARTRSAGAQHTGDLLLGIPHEGVDFRNVPPRRRVYELLFRDPAVGAMPRGETEKSASDVRIFADGGQVFVRGKERAGSLFTFRAGPPLGIKRYTSGERGAYGHGDPCNGSFLWLRRNFLCASGPGPTYRRDSASHNVITFDGKGQVGDGTVWLPDFFPPDILCPTPSVRADERSVSLSVETARNYLPYLRVTQCHRALWVDPDCAIVGVDTIACELPTSIEWNLHSWGTFQPAGGRDVSRWIVRCKDESLALHLLRPGAGTTSTGWTPLVPAYPHDGTRDRFFRWEIRGTSVRFVWSLSADGLSGAPEVSGSETDFTIRLSRGSLLRYANGELLPEGSC